MQNEITVVPPKYKWYIFEGIPFLYFSFPVEWIFIIIGLFFIRISYQWKSWVIGCPFYNILEICLGKFCSIFCKQNGFWDFAFGILYYVIKENPSAFHHVLSLLTGMGDKKSPFWCKLQKMPLLIMSKKYWALVTWMKLTGSNI